MLHNLFTKFLEEEGLGGTEGYVDVTSTGTEPTNSKTFTQEDLNRIVVKEKDKAIKSILKKLGFDDTATAESKLEEYRLLEEETSTTLEKVTKSKDKAESKLKELQDKLAQLEQEKLLMQKGVLTDKVLEVNALLSVYTNDDTSLEDALEKIKVNFPNLFSDETSTSLSGTGNSSNPPRNRQYNDESLSGIGERLAKERLKQSGLLKEEE